MTTLFQDVRNQQNIFSAWRHVKRSALSSNNADIRGKAAEFEHIHQRHLQRLIKQLRDKKFKFAPVKGVLKDRRKRSAQGKDPRPIAVATIENRVVQRAILQVLQPRKILDPRSLDPQYEIIYDKRLGRINEVNRSKFGVGGLANPYGGVGPAVQRIREAIDGGALFYYQSDIRAFFTKIPTKQVVEFVREETQDYQFAELFEKALAVELENVDELGKDKGLFPSDGIGVAQGSALSAFAGNVLLFEMDHELNQKNITCIRYIDDILMVSPSEESLEEAILYAKFMLQKFGFSLYRPDEGNGKAARGRCVDSINFLGYCIQPRRCVPSKKSIDTIKQKIRDLLSDSKNGISKFIQNERSLNSKHTKSATLEMLGKQLYGWQKSFGLSTNEQPFIELDKFVCDQVSNYEACIIRKLNKNQEKRIQVLGIPSTVELFKLKNKS